MLAEDGYSLKGGILAETRDRYLGGALALGIPGNFAIRVAVAKDDQSVSSLLEDSYPELMREHYDYIALSAALPIMCKANPLLLNCGTFYLAETRTREVIGCGGWTHEHPGSGNTERGLAHMRHFATHPAWIGRAVGRAIYVTCERHAHEAGAEVFETQSSVNAEGFYAAMGFETIEPMQVQLGNDVTLPGVLMRKKLKARPFQHVWCRAGIDG